MTTSSRYILELNGTPSVSSTNNSVVNIANVAGSGSNVAGSGSNVAVDLSTLGTVGGDTGTTYNGCLIGNITQYAGTTAVNSAVTCNSVAQLIQNASCKSANNCLANGNLTIDQLENITISNSTNTAISSISAIYQNNTCKVVVTDNDCKNLNAQISNSEVYCALDQINCNDGYCPGGYSCFLLQDDGENRNNNQVIHSFVADGSISTSTSSSHIEGITFTCQANQSIQYNYSNFDVSFSNSCSNSDKSYLIFIPKSTSTGTQSLGNSINEDGPINSPFIIANIENQNGDFYIEPICDTDGTHPILLSVLDNVVFG